MTAALGIACGPCGSGLVIITCDTATKSGHAWVLCTVCPACRLVTWTKDGCLDCADPSPSEDPRP